MYKECVVVDALYQCGSARRSDRLAAEQECGMGLVLHDSLCDVMGEVNTL